jgi:hypothetical protein
VIRVRDGLWAVLILAFALEAPLGPAPVNAKASLKLKDGRVLEGTDVRREGDLYILTIEGGAVVPVPAALVVEVGIESEPGDPAADELPTGLTYAEPQTLAGGPVEPPRTEDQLAVFGEPAKFQQDVVHTTLEPSYWVLDPAENNFNPSTWSESPIDSEWHPTSAFDPNEDVMKASESTWSKGPIDSTWVPQDGFKKSR